MPSAILEIFRVKARRGRSGFSLGARLAVWRSRRALAQLDARALDDIGLTKDEASVEARKAFWDVPTHWTYR